MSETSYRFTGHESFTCRHAWIPKAVEAISEDPAILGDIDAAMVRLGLGKNMVQSLRFWVQAMGVATPDDERGLELTSFGRRVFEPDGLDPYLEDVSTLWLLHWNLASESTRPLFAWEFLLSRFHASEIVRSDVLKVIERESRQLARPLSKATVAQHFDVFMRTYLPTRGRKASALEDNLDCPLIELELLRPAGFRLNGDGSQEQAFAFRREPKSELSPGVFLYAIIDFWDRTRPGQSTISLREIATSVGSPGAVFKLPEDEIRQRLGELEIQTRGILRYAESAMMNQVHRDLTRERPASLEQAYEKGLVDG